MAVLDDDITLLDALRAVVDVDVDVDVYVDVDVDVDGDGCSTIREVVIKSVVTTSSGVGVSHGCGSEVDNGPPVNIASGVGD